MNTERLIARCVARQQKRVDRALAAFGVALALRSRCHEIVIPRVAFGSWQPGPEWKPLNWECGGAVFRRRHAHQVQTVCVPWEGLPVRFVARSRGTPRE